jgi:hypothetical protein
MTVSPWPFPFLCFVTPSWHIFLPWVQNAMITLMLMFCVFDYNVVHVIILAFEVM